MGCLCGCKNKWHGITCEICDRRYSLADDCAACARAYEDYPLCHLTCTVEANCSGHASSVDGSADADGGCACKCLAGWTGPDCSLCPVGFKEEGGCSSCSEGYTGYPNCTRKCTEVDCNYHAVTVSGVEGSCACTCRAQWTGPTCNACPLPFDSSAGKDCDDCLAPYDTYPYCYLTCTVESNCSGRAKSVTGNTFKGCQCKCRNQWTGPSCTSCGGQFNENDDCSSCNSGYGGSYPECFRICTSDLDCSGHATNVTGLLPGCSCTCRSQWAGPACQQCPSNMI